MTTKTEWPYDAPKDDPLTPMRIPVVSTLYPNWFYLVSVCINDEPEVPLWHGLRPNDQEVTLVRSLIDYQRAWYNQGYVAREFDTRPFDIDGGFNSLTLIKRGEDDWAYRRRTWEYGPVVVPETWSGREQPIGLRALLDRIHSWGDREYNPLWVAWKAEHPEFQE